jgi:outer membrane protein assembly factor BamB
MDSSSKPADSVAGSTARTKSRRIWFPLLVIAAVGAWITRSQLTSGYSTLFDVIAVLIAALLISGWYLDCGGAKLRTRLLVVGSAWLAFIAWMIAFKPVFNGDMGIYSWRLRFASDADQSLDKLSAVGEVSQWKETPQDYPRFLGNGYWAEVSGIKLETDWAANPPQELWRHEIGAGWSSFAVVGDYAITQEQRGDQELVTCYRVQDGRVVWTHSDPTRFDPDDFAGGLGGVGPRATPTVHDAKVLTQGGTGRVNCLDARTGHVLWSHDTAAETGADVIVWGKSGSPLVVDDMVIVSVGAPNDPTLREDYQSSLVAYDLETGKVRWAAGNRQASYASPMVTTLAGERQIVMVNEGYVTAHRIGDGTVLWEYPWPNAEDTSASTTQPIPLGNNRLFLSKGYGVGASLLEITRDDDGALSATPLWNPPIKPVMKTKFSNVVVRDGFVFGLDNVLLSCIDAETGNVKWKKRRRPDLGHGQIMLVGDVILVLSETGELALVDASPERYRELASLQALDPANVTWSTPAFAPPYLLVRNAREAVCYKLPLATVNTAEQ